MIRRRIKKHVTEALDRQAAVALIGPRQVGKTTLAQEIAEERDALYLDLEDSDDRGKLSSPALFLNQYEAGWWCSTKSTGFRSCFRPCGV